MWYFSSANIGFYTDSLHVLFMRKWPRVKLDLAEDTNFYFVVFIISGINDKCKHEDR